MRHLDFLTMWRWGLLALFFGGASVANASDGNELETQVPGSGQEIVEALKPVGSASLSVFIWEIYESHLYTPTGIFEEIGPGTALKIQYKRNITSEQLVKTTKDEWKKLALYAPDPSDAWLKQLRVIWPDIKKSDELLLYVDEKLNSHFYLNKTLIGTLHSPEFTEQFLAIWLSPDTSRPRVRERLLNIGSMRWIPSNGEQNHS